ncbi:MAG: heavy metal-responsive transcriptional regulator [Alphaproteobacteria bacterium]
MHLTIGKLAELTGTTPDTLRYYEKIKLIAAVSRSDAGYRLYDADVIHRVQFIRGAKALNFTLEEIGYLMALNASDKTTCAEILSRIQEKIKQAQMRIIELQATQAVLEDLANQCPADDSPLNCCPIFNYINRRKS